MNKLQKLFLFFIIMLLSSCSKDYLLKRDIEKIATELKVMKEADQGVRQQSFLNFYYGINDPILNFRRNSNSLKWLNEKIEPGKTEHVMYKSQKLDSIKYVDFQYYKNEMESAMMIIDEYNTKKLIKITNKYGFPSHERLSHMLGDTKDKRLTSSPHLIFVHADI